MQPFYFTFSNAKWKNKFPMCIDEKKNANIFFLDSLCKNTIKQFEVQFKYAIPKEMHRSVFHTFRVCGEHVSVSPEHPRL